MQIAPENTGFGSTGGFDAGNNSGSTIALGDNAGSDVKQDAKQLGESAANRIYSEVDNRKAATAGQVQSVSSALNNVAGQLDEGSPQWLKSALQQGAQQVQRFADSLENKDARQIFDEVKTMARDNPGIFLAACAGIGFAAARVFKAGPSDSFQTPSQQTQFPPVQGEEPKYRASGTSDFGQSQPLPGQSPSGSGVSAPSVSGEFL